MCIHVYLIYYIVTYKNKRVWNTTRSCGNDGVGDVTIIMLVPCLHKIYNGGGKRQKKRNHDRKWSGLIWSNIDRRPTNDDTLFLYATLHFIVLIITSVESDEIYILWERTKLMKRLYLCICGDKKDCENSQRKKIWWRQIKIEREWKSKMRGLRVIWYLSKGYLLIRAHVTLVYVCYVEVKGLLLLVADV